MSAAVTGDEGSGTLRSEETISSPDAIDAIDVLGGLIWRMQNPDTIPPAFMCMSAEARSANRRLAEDTIVAVRDQERVRDQARAAGNPRAFFAE
jgi:hypothetical protein